MYVLCTLETINNDKGYFSATQIAAIRVDDAWKKKDVFSELIEPMGPSFHNWNDSAYSGYKVRDFLTAANAYTVLEQFEKWLEPDDVLCWWNEKVRAIYIKLYGNVRKRDPQQRSIALNKYFQAYLTDGMQRKGSVYKLCANRGMEVRGTEHCALDDVYTICMFLEAVRFPQEPLENRPPEKIYETNVEHEGRIYPYVYEPMDNQFHRKECPTLTLGIPLEPFEYISHCLKRGFDPCPVCVRKEVLAWRREHNRDVIERSKFRFVYAQGGKVFHKRECALVLGAQQIAGATYFYTCLHAGMRCCKVCKPLPLGRIKRTNDGLQDKVLPCEQKTVPAAKLELPKKKPKKIRLYPGISRTLSAAEARAMDRFAQAQKERLSQAEMDGLTQQQRKDHLTLTQPGLAFFAGTGYRTFHLRSCPALSGLTEIRGFATYEEAMSSGRRPCKTCRPTDKKDMEISVPITNLIRENESKQTLVRLCDQHGFAHRYRDQVFFMETPVGKWRIYVQERPVRMDHINLVKTPKNIAGYHRQPRLFLSLKDAFDYILRHDRALEKESDKLAEERRNEYAHCVQG